MKNIMEYRMNTKQDRPGDAAIMQALREFWVRYLDQRDATITASFNAIDRMIQGTLIAIEMRAMDIEATASPAWPATRNMRHRAPTEDRCYE